jgi:GTP-binding protein
MKVTVCRFHVSAARPGDFPRDGFPEVAFMGRSNVGKSSLMNRLLGARLARTSKTPGRTRSVNFYRVNERLYFVDLPGYGYARVPVPVRREWKGLVESYLTRPGRPDLAIVLVDARHEPTDLDVQLVEWLRAGRVPFRVALTKADAISGNGRTRALAAASARLALGADEPPLAVSARSGDGLPILWRAIDAILTARRPRAAPVPAPEGDGIHDRSCPGRGPEPDRAAGAS